MPPLIHHPKVESALIYLIGSLKARKKLSKSINIEGLITNKPALEERLSLAKKEKNKVFKNAIIAGYITPFEDKYLLTNEGQTFLNSNLQDVTYKHDFAGNVKGAVVRTYNGAGKILSKRKIKAVNGSISY